MADGSKNFGARPWDPASVFFVRLKMKSPCRWFARTLLLGCCVNVGDYQNGQLSSSASAAVEG